MQHVQHHAEQSRRAARHAATLRTSVQVTSADIRALTQDAGDAPGTRDIFTTRLSDAVAVLQDKISENGAAGTAHLVLQDPGSEYGAGSALGSGHRDAAHVDELSLLLADTPLAKLRAKEEELSNEAAAGEDADPWHLLRLQQELLALARLHTQLNRQADHRPLLVPTAHFQLAQVRTRGGGGAAPDTLAH